jgi:hypothetical protein
MGMKHRTAAWILVVILACTAAGVGYWLMGDDALGDLGFVVRKTRLRAQWRYSVRAHGPDHPSTVGLAEDLAYALHERGDQRTTKRDRVAEVEVWRDIVASRERYRGIDDPETLRSVMSLADALYYADDLAGAAAMYRRVLTAREATFGVEDKRTVEAATELAYTLCKMRDFAGGERLLWRVLDWHEQLKGTGAESTLRICDRLAAALVAQGKCAQAIPVAEQIATNLARRYREEHPAMRHARDRVATIKQQLAEQIAGADAPSEKAGKQEKSMESTKQQQDAAP